MTGFARRRFEAIASDRVLSTYGALIALIHPLTAWAWLDPHVGAPVPEALAPGGLAICWPFFPTCGEHRPFEPATWRVLVIAYGLCGVACAALWLRRRFAAWPLQVALEFATVAVVLQDYRLRLNEHYMALFATVAFLLLPFDDTSASATRARRDVLRVTLVAFYVWAGLLKLTPDWLTGAALPHLPLGIPASMSAAACKYVVVLELVVVWGLLVRSRWVFWTAFAQVLLFHITSFTVVGYFYPLLMGLLLSIFVLARRADESVPAPDTSVLRRLLFGALPRSGYAYLAAFSLLQLVPRLYPGDSAVTGEGRWMALHMFDARMLCRGSVTLHRKDGSVTHELLQLQEALRIHCDPLVAWARARALCSRHRDDPTFDGFDLLLETRHASETSFRRVIDQPRFCPDVPEYTAFSHNPWIHLEAS